MKRMKFTENMKTKDKKTMDKKGVVLLSSGLDSLVSLYMAKKECDIVLALTFDYGQKAAWDEINAAKKITSKFNIEHKIVELPFLKKAVNNALTNDSKTLEFDELGVNSMKAVWIPNRNGLFLNIAAMYCDSLNLDCIIFGANKEEAATFSDNSQKFIDDMNEVLKTSTNYDIKVTAPLIEFDKNEIVKKAIELKVPLKYINSCYNSQKGHCGHCESCSRLKRALKNNGCDKILKELFSD